MTPRGAAGGGDIACHAALRLGVYAFYLSLGTDLIVVPVLVMALLLALFIPHLDLLARPYPWAVPGVAGLAATAALIAGSLATAPDAANPQTDSIWYALNADTGQALWISEDAAPDSWTSQFLGTTYKRGQLPDLFPHLSNAFLSAPAPVVDLTAPQVDLLNDSSTAGTRTLRLHVTTPRQPTTANLCIARAGCRGDSTKRSYVCLGRIS